MKLLGKKNSLSKLNWNMTDNDQDGYPNIIDCKPNNPKKQGALSWVIAKATGKTHDEVDTSRRAAKSERETERHQEQLLGLQRKSELAEARKPLEQARYEQQKRGFDISERRSMLMAKQQKSMGPMPSLMGGFGESSSKGPMPSLMGGMPSLMKPFAEPVNSRPKPRKVKRITQKRKTKRKSYYTIRVPR